MRDDDEIRSRIGRGLELLPPPEGRRIERVVRRARVLRVRRVAGATAVAALMLIGVAVPLGMMRGIGGRVTERQAPLASGSAAGTTVPDMAEVRCDGDGTHVLTPEVRPQPDGVHIRVDNRTGTDKSFVLDSGSGTTAPVGVHQVEDPATGAIGWDLPPGQIAVRCLGDDQDNGDPAGYVPFHVVDPDGLWEPDSVQDCEYVSVAHPDYVDLSTGRQGDPVEITRDSGLVEEGDTVMRVGYPQAAHPKVAVLRDGRVRAVVRYQPSDDGGWLEEETMQCAEAPSPETLPGSGAGSGGGSSGAYGGSG